MRSLKVLLILSFLLLTSNIFSQELSQKEEDKKEVKKLYSDEENDFLEKWFYDNIKEMKFTENEQAEYYKILLNHTSNMERLENSTNDFTNKELKQKLVDIVDEMNLQMKDFLTANQYEIHEKSFDKILWNVFIRNGWNQD